MCREMCVQYYGCCCVMSHHNNIARICDIILKIRSISFFICSEVVTSYLLGSTHTERRRKINLFERLCGFSQGTHTKKLKRKRFSLQWLQDQRSDVTFALTFAFAGVGWPLHILKYRLKTHFLWWTNDGLDSWIFTHLCLFWIDSHW